MLYVRKNHSDGIDKQILAVRPLLEGKIGHADHDPDFGSQIWTPTPRFNRGGPNGIRYVESDLCEAVGTNPLKVSRPDCLDSGNWTDYLGPLLSG
jgi:hypothetical protein